MINPEPTISLAPAALSDLDAIDRIEQEAFNTPWSRDLLRAAILNRQYVVQVLRDEATLVAGFYIAHTVQQRSNLDNLAVDVPARLMGYGRRLIEDWMERSHTSGLHLLTLQVNTANKAAQRLYEAHGFRTTRLLVSYYPNGEDAYQMELSLTRPQPGESAADEAASRFWFGRRRVRQDRRP